MNAPLATALKAEYQQQYSKFEAYYEAAQTANEALKTAKASRIWILALLFGVFSFRSEFLLGVAAALMALYGYQIITAYLKKVQAEDELEEIERWFLGKGLMFRDATLFLKEDVQLENPIDVFKDSAYQ